jgi:hypothetical protein
MDPVLTTYSINQVQFNAPWHDLKHAWVGASYSPKFYEPVKNIKVRESLQKIARETEEDYLNLVSTLTRLGVHVERPAIDPELTIIDYTDAESGRLTYENSGSYTLIPKPPMQARDCALVVGNDMILTNTDSKWFQPLVQPLTVNRLLRPQQEFDAPMATVVGKHIILDCREAPWLHEYFQTEFPDHTIVPVYIGGHNDSVFCLLKPGVLVSTHHHSNYSQTLPGWQVKFIENQSWNAIPDWRKLKHSNSGRWWTPDSDSNAEFTHFVDTWLGHWLGYVEETVFDVNMLQINDHTVLVNNYNKEMFDFFKQQRVEPIITPFRHRFFWDGGIHCITNDIYRLGEVENYVC